MTIPKSEWVWYGYAGHLIVAKRCAYHLCTRIGNRLVSTVGAFYPSHSAPMNTVGAGKDDYFETYIFKCDGETEDGNPNVADWMEIEGYRYATSIEAERNHRKICDRIAEEEQDD